MEFPGFHPRLYQTVENRVQENYTPMTFKTDPNAVAQPIQLRSQQHQQSRKPSSQKSAGGNSSAPRAKPSTKRSAPPKKSFSR